MTKEVRYNLVAMVLLAPALALDYLFKLLINETGILCRTNSDGCIART